MIRSIKTTCIVLVATFGICLAKSNTTTAGSYPADVASDMALIYQGSIHRPDWTENQLTPYVTHTFTDGHTDWFFNSFLFLEFTNNWEVAYGYGYGSRYAKKGDWEWLLNRIFERGKSLDALNKCIEHNKARLGEPKIKHKIVLGIVSPISGQTDWGTLDGQILNFEYQSAQIKAAKWCIDQLMKRFADGGYNNLELVGFYWIEESTGSCRDLPKYINQYIHQLGKRAYWIPYWGAEGYNEWKELGYDTAFLQPNYFFDKNVIDARLDDACRTAKQFDMALEMEFDSNVLYEKPNSSYNRLEKYIDAFEKYGVFEKSAIAYYSGTKGILDMYNSSAIENTIILDRIANHIVERRNRALGMDSPLNPKTGIIVVGGIGMIYVSGTAKSIQVYTINGTLISENNKSTQCSPGIYIVRVDGETTKVIVQ
ncbi:MAG: DUF4855 domain-containing protein [Muribaculaceae bacterium]